MHGELEILTNTRPTSLLRSEALDPNPDFQRRHLQLGAARSGTRAGSASKRIVTIIAVGLSASIVPP